MEAWEVWFLALILDLVFGNDTPVDATYVVKQTDSCPDVGYFFRREQPLNSIHPGPCFLCFCQSNGTAVCWERDRARCDVEKFHHHRVGRSRIDYNRHARIRRSPIGLTDIFFRDATRNFFIHTLPKKCKPFKSSFSDGCPPEDWCLGCTICDCDAQGHWDCRVLSFCDGKKNETGGKPRIGKKIISKNHTTGDNTTSSSTKAAKKIFIKFLENKNKNNTEDKLKKNITLKPKKKNKEPIIKPQKNKPEPTKSQPITTQQYHPNANISNIKIIKRHIAARKPMSLERGNIKTLLKFSPKCNETVKRDQKIVKKVMTIIQKVVISKEEKINERKSVKLNESKKCEELQKMDKKTYKMKSNAAARNKTKLTRQTIIKENYKFTRSKREILNEAQAKAVNVNVIALKTDDSVIPLETKPGYGFTKFSINNVTVAVIPTTQQENYFKYSIKNDVDESTTIKITKNTTESYKTKINKTSVGPKINITSNAQPNNKTVPTMHPNFNDLKVNKWLIIKVKADNRKKPFKRLLYPKPKMTLSDYAFTTYKEHLKSKMVKKDVEPQHNATKQQKWYNHFMKNCSKELNNTTVQNFKNKTYTSSLNFLHKLFAQLNKNNTERKEMKRKIGIMKYVRKFFHKLFSKKDIENHKVYGIGTKEDHTLQILCENLGPCKINRKNKFILKYKLKQLNKETENILRSIRIIKGLLHVLVLPTSDGKYNLNRNCSFQNDVLKLGLILRNNYNMEEMNTTLTDAHLTLINQIKKNTHIFIESVRKFTDKLNETLAIIKPDFVNDNYAGNPEKKLPDTIPLQKIKKMLHRYNIMQNHFMKKIYELMNEAEKEASITTERIKTQLINPQEQSNVIERYSRNIIENIRRLKDLAQKLNAKRKKRNIMTGNGPIEYLLNLMEYLIKHNQPLKIAPARDGIDVLIDVIRNAPDIKPIKKKMIYYTPVTKTVKLNADAELSEQLTEENSDFQSNDKVLKEDKTKSDDINTLDYITPKRFIKVSSDSLKTNKLYETTTEYNFLTRKRSNEVKEKTGFDKFESNIDLTKTDEVAVVDIEEDSFGNSISNSTVASATTGYQHTTSEQTTEIVNFPETTTTETIPKMQFNESISSESQDLTNDSNKTKADWMEETFEKEIKEFNELNASYPMEPTTAINISTRTSTAKHIDNISGISVEVNDDGAKTEKRLSQTLRTEDLMHRKQLEFLNSLDYGNEKSNFNDSVDSKDDVRLDDGFPEYFV